MNLGRLLSAVRQRLERRGVPDASLEAEIMARHILGMDRAELHARPEHPVSPEDTAAIESLADRRVAGEPTAYLTGRRWFYGLEFIVASDVLVPRPETELVVEVAADAVTERNYHTAADIGTGSGVIAVCLARSAPNLSIIATDTSEAALDIACRNAECHEVADRITFCLGNLLEPLAQPVDILCANLPYVRTSDIPRSGPLRHEPRTALDGGADGLDVFRRFAPRVAACLCPGGCLVLEIGAGQAKAVLVLLEKHLPAGKFTVHRDLAGHERVIEFRLTV